jgi:glycosyltransferase involved in cell wall biosynthesis
MRLVFLETTIEEGKGIPNRAVALASGLSSLGHDVTLLAFRTDRENLPPGLRVLPLRSIGNLPLPFRAAQSSNPLLWRAANLFIQRAIDRADPEIVCVDYTPLDAFALYGRGRRRYKVVYTYHGVANPEHYEGAAREARIRNRTAIHRHVRDADLVISVSRFCAREIEAAGTRSEVLPNGVDTEFFHPGRRIPALRGEAPLLLHIGRYTEHKGALDCLRAFRIIRREIPKATLLCFARHESSAYVKRLQAYVAEEGLAGSAFLFRDVYGDLVPSLYATADVFMSGARDETFGMTFLEAAACGTPSVAFDSQSIPEVVTDGVTGLLAPAGDVEGLAARAVALLRDAPRRRAMGDAARKHALSFAWDTLSARLDARLRALVSVGTP